MEACLESRKAGASQDALIILQHSPVYTLGRGADMSNVKFDPQTSPADVYKVERGGDVTWHGPGQLVMYPVLDLLEHKKDLHW